MIILPRLITRVTPLSFGSSMRSKKREKREKRKTHVNDQLSILFEGVEEINPSMKNQKSHPEYDGGDGFMYVKSRVSDQVILRYDKETGETDKEYTKELFKKLENGR